MAIKDPAALLYIDVWKAATTEMSAIERAYYMDLILHQYDKGSLPNDIEELANICRVRFSEFEQFKQVFKQVLEQKFVQNENGRLENGFASEIIRKRQKFIDKRSNSGKISYMVRFINKHFKVKKDVVEWLKDNINFDDVDIKNEQVFKQVLEQKIELYINGDVNENINEFNPLMNNVNIEEIPESEKEYFKIAKAFWDLFKKQKESLGVSPTTLMKAKYLNWIDPVRLMIDNDECSLENLQEIYKYLRVNEFWKNKIASISKLRQQRETLLSQAREKPKKDGKKSSNTKSTRQTY